MPEVILPEEDSKKDLKEGKKKGVLGKIKDKILPDQAAAPDAGLGVPTF